MHTHQQSSPGFLNPKDLVIRHLIIAVLALFFGTMGHWDETKEELMQMVGSTFLNIALIWNGNILLIDIVDYFLTWEKYLYRKLVVSGIIALGWPILVNFIYNIYIYPLVHGHPCDLSSKENTIYLIMSVVITLFINTIFISIAFFRFWKLTIKEKEELKRESLSAEFETLKNQINPHFLFNSLNTLTSLIEENGNTAVDFVQKLASVYRYLLTQKDKELVTLKEELDFVEAYIYLNKIRFGDNLHINVNVDPTYLNKKMATLSLQILVENSIKHNVISSQYPLVISIETLNERVIVRNTIQKKNVLNESNGIGLNNIAHRYSFISDQEVEIADDGKYFTVSLPLIKSN